MGTQAPLGVSASGKPPNGDAANAVVSGLFAATGPGAPFAFRGPMNVSIYASFNTSLTTAAGSLAATLGSAGAVAVGNAVNSVNVPPGTTIGTIVGTAVTLKIPPIALTAQITAGQNRMRNLARTDGMVGATVTGPGIPNGTTVVAVITPAFAPQLENHGGAVGVVQLSANATLTNQFTQLRDFYSFQRTGNAIQTTGADANAIFTGAEIVYVGTPQLERSFDGGATWLVANVGGSGVLAQWPTGTPVNVTFGEPEKLVLYRINIIAYASGAINYRISETGGAAESLGIGQLI